MRIEKWVDFGQEVTVEIGVEDVRGALAEAFANVTNDRLGEEKPTARDVMRCFNLIATFLVALTDEQIGMLNDAQQRIIREYLLRQGARYKERAGQNGEPMYE